MEEQRNKLLRYLDDKSKLVSGDNMSLHELNKEYNKETVTIPESIEAFDEYMDEILAIVESAHMLQERRYLDIVNVLSEEQKESLRETFTASEDNLLDHLPKEDKNDEEQV